jgi:hypothetical protein
MTDKFEEIVDNLKQSSHWVRLPFMVAFGFILYLVFVPVVIVMMVAQILFALTTGQSNRNLRGLGSVVQQYVSQIIDYITYNSDERPFPFSDFPEEDISVVENSAPKMTEPEAKVDDSKPEKKEEKTRSNAAKPVKKAKSSTSKSKAATASTASTDKPSTTKKPAAKKAPAKKKVSVQAGIDSAEASSPVTETETGAPAQATGTDPS